MSDVEIILRLPETLVERIRAAGLEIESITPDIIALLEKRLTRQQAWQNLIDIADQLQGSLTPEEIEAELAAAKAERIASNNAE
jgi:hypothetical protein